MARQLSGLTNRSTVDLLVLLFATTVCAAILLAGASVTILAFLDRQTDDSANVVVYLERTLTTIIGALLGLVAGRTTASSRGATTVPPTTAERA